MIGPGWSMRLRRKLGSFRQMTVRQRLLVLEAVLLLGVSRFVLLALPFSRIAPWLQCAPDLVPATLQLCWRSVRQ